MPLTPVRGCDFCVRTGVLIRCVCAAHGHTVGVNACPRHAVLLDDGKLFCRVCALDVAAPDRHRCRLARAPGGAEAHA